MDGKINIDDLITHVLPLDHINEGFDLMTRANRSVAWWSIELLSARHPLSNRTLRAIVAIFRIGVLHAMPTPDRFRAAGVVLASGLAAAAPAWAATPQEIAERAVTQEGLAIGLASNVLQSQVEILFTATGGKGTLNQCQKLLTGGPGATELTSTKQVFKGVTQADVSVFYDSACAKPYITADATVTALARGYSIVETATYIGVGGATLGSLSLSESAKTDTAGTGLLGTGTFRTPAATGSTSVSLGLQCSLPNKSAPFPARAASRRIFRS